MFLPCNVHFNSTGYGESEWDWVILGHGGNVSQFLLANYEILISCTNSICAFESFQVHLVQLGENNADLICKGLYPHQNEIWDLASCPFESSFFSTVYAKGTLPLVCLNHHIS